MNASELQTPSLGMTPLALITAAIRGGVGSTRALQVGSTRALQEEASMPNQSSRSMSDRASRCGALGWEYTRLSRIHHKWSVGLRSADSEGPSTHRSESSFLFQRCIGLKALSHSRDARDFVP